MARPNEGRRYVRWYVKTDVADLLEQQGRDSGTSAAKVLEAILENQKPLEPRILELEHALKEMATNKDLWRSAAEVLEWQLKQAKGRELALATGR